MSTLVKTTSSDPLLQLTVKDYLWGYDDPLISLASTFVPTIIPFKKLGLLDRMFDDGVNVVTINLPERVQKLREIERLAEEAKKVNATQTTATTNDTILNEIFDVFHDQNLDKPNDAQTDTNPNLFSPLIRDYSIDMWNGSPGLHHWGWTNDKDSAPER